MYEFLSRVPTELTISSMKNLPAEGRHECAQLKTCLTLRRRQRDWG